MLVLSPSSSPTLCSVCVAGGTCASWNQGDAAGEGFTGSSLFWSFIATAWWGMRWESFCQPGRRHREGGSRSSIQTLSVTLTCCREHEMCQLHAQSEDTATKHRPKTSLSVCFLLCQQLWEKRYRSSGDFLSRRTTHYQNNNCPLSSINKDGWMNEHTED